MIWWADYASRDVKSSIARAYMRAYGIGDEFEIAEQLWAESEGLA